MKRPFPWLGLLATLALFVTACGGNDTLSAEAYFSSLQDVFDPADTRTQDLFETLGDEPDAEAFAAFLVGEQALFADVRAGTTALSPPSELAAAHDAFLDAMDAAIEEIERAREAGKDNLETLFDQAGNVFEEFGRTCGTLQQIAEERGIDVALSCATE